jgi:Phage tail tube protein, GTA-gp10
MTATANAARGEISITLDGVEAVLRPSRDAIRKIEEATGFGLVRLCTLAGSGDLTLDQCAKVLVPLLRAGARENDIGMKNANESRVGDLVMESELGLLAVLKRIEVVLWLAATGGYDATGEPKTRETAKT